jgi:hypothetical protein
MDTKIAALYVHGPRSTRPEDTNPTAMIPIHSVEAVEGMGLREDTRYFRRPPDAHERKRQVSLIDEGTIWRLEQRFGPISREFIKAQIILEGEIFLPGLVGSVLQLDGGAELTVALERVPCYAMDLIAPGVRAAMEAGQQGALARVTASGRIGVGSPVRITDAAPALTEATI